ncbi:NUDIX hydrolase domain-like protein [Tylopilus felleus]
MLSLLARLRPSRLLVRIHTSTMLDPKVLSTEPLDNAHSKFVGLTKIHYQDQDGKKRVWECAERKVVQGHTGKDAVAIFAILKSKTNAFPLSTVILEQYRPPLDKHVIEFPAGLLNAPTTTSGPDEEAQVAALRELEEETGYKATLEDVLECSPTVASDPGMTTAKMKLVVVKVELEDKMEYPVPKPDPGEHIVIRVVELAQLNRVLQDYDKKGFIVDARLSHFASGYGIAERIRNGRI